jgi:hypothetical protein
MITKQEDFIRKLIREELNSTKTHILSKTPEEIIKYVGNDVSGFNNRQDAIDEIDYLLNAEFPSGFKNIPNRVLLYRVLLLEDNESINEYDVGEHFIAEPNLIDIGFLEKIGVWDSWSDESKLWLLTCEVDKKNIDFERTIGNRLLYPRENEFTLFDKSKIKMVNKKILKKENIRY